MNMVMLLRAHSAIRRLERAAGSADHAPAMINLKLTTHPTKYQPRIARDEISILMLKALSQSLTIPRLLATLKPSQALPLGRKLK